MWSTAGAALAAAVTAGADFDVPPIVAKLESEFLFLQWVTEKENEEFFKIIILWARIVVNN